VADEAAVKKASMFKIFRVFLVLGAGATLAWALEEFKPETKRRPPAMRDGWWR
jgi:hypothetical protein